MLVLVAGLLAGRWPFSPPSPPPPGTLEEGVYQVERVVDGDTLVLTNGAKVRLIGADTPETKRPDYPVEPFGPEATRFTKDFVAGGQVRLTFDGRRRDRYDRFLAHVWVGDRMLEEELIRNGLARAITKYDYSQSTKDRYVALEAEARAAGRGMWSNDETP